MIMTKESGKKTIYTFPDTSNRILRSAHKSSGLSKDEVIDMAATIIKDDIRSKVYDVTNYLKCDDMANSELVPETLSRFLAGVIKTKSNSPKPAEMRR